MYKTNRYLSFYLRNKFSQTISDISEDELIKFLNQTGWELHDSETMISKFLSWRAGKDLIRAANRSA